jgi:hypothetical protein
LRDAIRHRHGDIEHAHHEHDPHDHGPGASPGAGHEHLP